ncbi:hypothetical protein M2302_002261 [Micromonospora sp. A200]|uniref:DUF2786 domain-containing protein n=1 Tax=Micromonospora sp. A200 TaxID=2940568 RepID=UPI002475F81F|nr:DUF2786 domain-containing protein [Micromonospora sp. A200]MDH6462086.1 hypothetical protein [Micromonospora sp. A200]
MLDRIRKMLTLAENPAATPAEAEAFTAKATELMAQYGITRAMLASADPTTDVIGDKIVVIEGAYALDKQRLLDSVAQALGAKCVLRTRYPNGKRQYQVHLFAYGSDLERIEMLYTSLLVQMANGLAQAEAPPTWWESTVAFRKSWIEGFRVAIYQRLTEAEKRAKQQAEQVAQPGGPSVALVLADRATLVKAQRDQAYGKLGQARQRSFKGSGAAAGYRAGQRADLGGSRLGGRGRPALAR